MKHLSTKCVVVIIFAATGAANGQESPFKSEEGGFSVQMPGAPKHNSQKIAGSSVTQHTFVYESKDGTSAHLVAYQIDANLAGLSKEKMRDVLRAARDGAQKALKAEFLNDKDIDYAGHLGCEFKLKVPDLKAEYRSRIFIVGDRLYQITVLGPREVTESKNTDAFLKSFKLLDKKK